MIEILLASTLSCSDANWLIQGIRDHGDLSPAARSELILEVMSSTEESCDFKPVDRTK